MNGLADFNLYIQARDCMERARSNRGSIWGISCDKDGEALDWQAAECIARVTEYHIRKSLGQEIDYKICMYCGWDTPRCYCDWYAKRGIDTHNIHIEEGIVRR